MIYGILRPIILLVQAIVISSTNTPDTDSIPRTHVLDILSYHKNLESDI